MALSHLLLGAFLIVLGISWLGWVTVSATFLGVFALITGIVWLVEAWHPVVVPVGRRQA